jgi:GT2 family glycosyltransferase
VFNVDRKQDVQAVAWKCLSEEEWEEVRVQLSSGLVTKREDIRRNLTKEEIDSGELQEVIIPSCGCMLVSRSVFGRFEYGLLDVPGKLSTGDDIYFCRKVREAGVKLYCDPSVRCEHLTEGKFGEDGVHPLHR